MWTTRFGKRGLYEFSMCLTEQEGVTGDDFVVFFWFLFFLPVWWRFLGVRMLMNFSGRC